LRATYHPLFEKYDVDLVLQAYNHHYQRSYPILYNDDNPKDPIITDDNNNNFNDPKGHIFTTIGTGGSELYPLTGQASFTATQYEGFGFLNVDVINSNNERTTAMIGKFYANDSNGNDSSSNIGTTITPTIKDKFTIIKSIVN
jgi:hypothetical protein